MLGDEKYQEIQRTTLSPGLSILGPRMMNRLVEIVPEEAGTVPPTPPKETGQWSVDQLVKLVTEQPERLAEFVAAEQARPQPRTSAIRLLRSAVTKHPELAGDTAMIATLDGLSGV